MLPSRVIYDSYNSTKHVARYLHSKEDSMEIIELDST